MMKESMDSLKQEKKTNGTLIVREYMPSDEIVGCTYTEEELEMLVKKHFPHYFESKEKTG